MELATELAGGGCPALGRQPKVLRPGEYATHQHTLSLWTHTVIKYWPHDGTEPRVEKRGRWSPPWQNQVWNEKITDLLGYNPSLNFQNDAGYWDLVWSIQPVVVPTSKTVSWKTGTTQANSSSVTHKMGVKVMFEYANAVSGKKGGIEASYELAVQTASETEFTKEETFSVTMNLQPGQSVALWQYVLRAECLSKHTETRLNQMCQTAGGKPCPPIVFLKSHHGTHLQDANGNVKLHANRLSWEQWKLVMHNHHAANNVVFVSHRGERLSAKSGVKLEKKIDTTEIFYLIDASNGKTNRKVYIRNHVGQHLSAHPNGSLSWSPNMQAWEEWTIDTLSGMDPQLVLGKVQ
mmetsp:Transcript_55397/g.103973  ORF Transcript_55397/g.103973 Transcript_55397/m.103973 type:complete len:349 (+) Transcript_55397:106-1152(+)